MSETMKVTKEDLVAVMDWAGYKLAKKWNDARLKKKALGLWREVPEDEVIGNNHLDNVLDELIYAGREGKGIELVSSKEEPEEEQDDEDDGPVVEDTTYVEPPPPVPQKYGDLPKKPVERRKSGSLSRAAAAARIFFQHGMDNKYTPDMIVMADQLYTEHTGKKSNLGTQRVITGVAHGALMEYLELLEGSKK